MSYFVKHRPCVKRASSVKLIEWHIDQFPAEPQNIAANGFAANDLTLLRMAQTEAEFAALSRRLTEIKDVQNDGRSDDEILNDIRPFWMQSPYEVEKFMDYLNAQPIPSNLDSSVKDTLPVSPVAEPQQASTGASE